MNCFDFKKRGGQQAGSGSPMLGAGEPASWPDPSTLAEYSDSEVWDLRHDESGDNCAVSTEGPLDEIRKLQAEADDSLQRLEEAPA